MTLESVLKNLTAAIEANTAAISSVVQATPASASSTADSPKPATAKAEPTPAPAAEAAAEAPAEGIDKKTLTKTVMQIAKDKGREAAAQLLAGYQVTKVSDLDPSTYDEVYAAALQILA